MAGTRPRDGHRTLDGWQEIADHLGKAVSTVQRWEKTHRLPVRRLSTEAEGSKGGGVFAFADEIDAWRETGGVGNDPSGGTREPVIEPPVPSDGGSARRPRPWIWIGVVTVLAIAVVVLGVALLWPVGAIDDRLYVTWETGNTLVARRFDGGVAWTRSEAVAMRLPGGSSFQPTSVEAVDLDGDGNEEFLVLITPLKDRGVADYLVALDARGEELWRFQPGAALRIDGTAYDANFTLNMLRVVPTPEPVLVVAANHRLQFPAIVSLLDTSGREVARYLHAGWINDLLAVELTGVSGKTIAFGGVNNLLEAPVIGVLPLRAGYRGTSPGPGSWGVDVTGNVELAYLRLPRTRLSLELNAVHSYIRRLTPSADPNIAFSATVSSPYRRPYEVSERQEYILRFDRSLSVVASGFTDDFRAYLERGRALGWHELTMADEIVPGGYEALRASPDLDLLPGESRR